LHTFPQAPQFVVLVERFTQAPLQVVPPIIIQAFVAVNEPLPRLRPDPEDPEEVVVTDTVVVTAAVGPVVTSAGTFVQVDALQNMPVGHMFPQIPQFAALDESS
jgi:hypothetical protein